MGEQANNIFDFNCRIKWCSKDKSNLNSMIDNKGNRNFLYVVTPDVKDCDELDSESWEGSIKQMSKLCQTYIDQVNGKLTRQMTELKDQLEGISKREVA